MCDLSHIYIYIYIQVSTRTHYTGVLCGLGVRCTSFRCVYMHAQRACYVWVQHDDPTTHDAVVDKIRAAAVRRVRPPAVGGLLALLLSVRAQSRQRRQRKYTSGHFWSRTASMHTYGLNAYIMEPRLACRPHAVSPPGPSVVIMCSDVF